MRRSRLILVSMINVEIFDGDEVGYRRWLDAHPFSGYIVNWTRHRDPWYPMMHRRGCPILHAHRGNHTTNYPKAACDSEELLKLWLKVNDIGGRGGDTRECGHCMGVWSRVNMRLR
ncbi:MAG TPA: hypothetical protein VFI41_04940 [Gemmatimonadales bacterium]|nr:hypothetical protein [Gemmatimonadales bacterium]